MAAALPIRPAEVFASLEKRPEGRVEGKSSGPCSRTIAVSGMAEIEVPPDRIVLSVSVLSSKNGVEEARSSVKRRRDYIRQVLRNHGMRENTYDTSTSVWKDSTAWNVRTEFTVTFADAAVCERVENVLTEKLQTGVIVSRPVFRHTQQCIEAGRQQTCLLAVQNAKSKASLIARALKEEVGRTISVCEESMDEYQREETALSTADFRITTQSQMKMAARSLQATVNIVFELKLRRTGKIGKKC